jgi:hypothetical protein
MGVLAVHHPGVFSVEVLVQSERSSGAVSNIFCVMSIGRVSGASLV